MLSNAFTTLAVAVVASYGVTAKPTLSTLVTSTFRIQNVGTGLFLDAFESGQGAGTSVIVQTLNQPFTNNQEWNLTLTDGSVGTLQSISSFVVSTIVGNDLAIALFPDTASAIALTTAPDGVFICVTTVPITCFTSPDTAVSQVLLQPFTGSPEQTWLFNLV